MPRMIRISLLSLGVLFLAAASAAGAGKVRLFVLSGQSNMAGLNPDVSFTPAVKKAYPDDQVVVVKSAQGGQPIRRWYKAWQPPAGSEAPPGENGDLYQVLMAAVTKALNGRKPDSVVFVWMQGENDASKKWDVVYAASLRGLIGQLRTDLKQEKMPFVIGRLSDCRSGNANWDAIRAIQVQVAEGDTLGAWVDTDDLNDKNGKNDLHYTKEGYATFGQRCADKAVQLLKKAE